MVVRVLALIALIVLIPLNHLPLQIALANGQQSETLADATAEADRLQDRGVASSSTRVP